jgi:hypothetical protein
VQKTYRKVLENCKGDYEMKKNVLSSMFGLGVILISLFLLASCRPEEKIAAAVALPETAGIVSTSGSAPVDYEQAAANHAARWQAMAQFYADHDMLNERFDYEQAADNLAARWQAMGLFYEKNGLLNTPSK